MLAEVRGEHAMVKVAFSAVILYVRAALRRTMD